MTKKHFIAMAEGFKRVRPEQGKEEAYLQWQMCVKVFCDVALWANNNFNSERFWEACEK